MANLGDFLAQSLVAAEPPSEPGALVEYAGGHRAFTEAMTGLDHSPRRSEYPEGQRGAERYAADYKSWRSTYRRAQRADPSGKEGKQRRGTVEGVKLTPAQRQRLRAAATGRKVEKMRKRGMRVRMHAKMKRKSPGKRGEPARWREIPTGPGVLLEPEHAADILQLIRAGEHDAAVAAFRDDVLDSYFGRGGAEAWNIEDVDQLEVWAEGDPEPG